jgi:C4-dicarboxylate-specific signal transduction histidine kinase
MINAIQAMPSGAIPIKTGMNFKPTARRMPPFYAIQGQRAGIVKECMDRLFDPFFTTKEEGTGMGLPIVDSILRFHGGSVFIDSTRGKGTTVTLSIPAKTDFS